MSSPFLKWVGGKRRFACNRMRELLPKDFAERRYVEPMIGGGACFWEFGSKGSIIADSNPRLIRTYRAVRDSPVRVIDSLRGMNVSNDSYYDYRDRFNSQLESDGYVAALMIYLNHWCFNGLYRENRKGGFNASWGKKSTSLDKIDAMRSMKSSLIYACSKSLQGVDVRCGDILDVLSSFIVDDDVDSERLFIYLDPPYVVGEDKSGFTSYTSGGFDLSTLVKMSELLRELSERGAAVMLSHADVPVARDTFEWMNRKPVAASTTISTKPSGRGVLPEVVLTNY